MLTCICLEDELGELRQWVTVAHEAAKWRARTSYARLQVGSVEMSSMLPECGICYRVTSYRVDGGRKLRTWEEEARFALRRSNSTTPP